MQRDLPGYLADIVSAGEDILTYVDGMEFSVWEEAQMVQAAVTYKYAVIGEALNQALQLAPALREKIEHARDIVDLRNRVIHGYFTVDERVIWSITRDELPKLIENVKALRGDLPS